MVTNLMRFVFGSREIGLKQPEKGAKMAESVLMY
jgi:hypothetical protein